VDVEEIGESECSACGADLDCSLHRQDVSQDGSGRGIGG
jgi:hypothetical protein